LRKTKARKGAQLFSCQQFEEVASGAPGFTIGSFEDEYPILRGR